MLTHIPFPALPVPPSWFPGHMLQFQRTLPTLLNKTDVVLELRDARLPLTSINRNFEGAFLLAFSRDLRHDFHAASRLSPGAAGQCTTHRRVGFRLRAAELDVPMHGWGRSRLGCGV